MFLLICWLQVTTARTAVVDQLLLIAPASAWIRLAINANMCLSANHSTLGPWNQYGIKLKIQVFGTRYTRPSFGGHQNTLSFKDHQATFTIKT